MTLGYEGLTSRSLSSVSRNPVPALEKALRTTARLGHLGLLNKKHTTLVLTAVVFGSRFPSPAFGVDHQATYLHARLEQASIAAIDEVRFEPVLAEGDGSYYAKLPVACAYI